MGSVLGVIPTRLASTRLPGKPLVDIAGRPLIEWVWRRMSTIPVLDDLVVATADQEVVEAVGQFGGRALLTDPNHESGTDRVAEVASRKEYQRFDLILNLQGDEPFLPPGAAAATVGLLRAGWAVGTAAVPIRSRAEWEDPSVVKVVRNDEGGAMYFTRAPVPHDRGGQLEADAHLAASPLRHVGIYGFRRAVLQRLSGLGPHPLERREGLEQLRWLAAGIRIGVAVVEGGAPGVDTEADLERAEAMLGGREEST
ncbi:MAG: 3-deoxy-manno-octulosonate cytidylyltransferase [Gemmatimonadota bacterium]|nr:MAG: 3-deoxy-manno-octulosonate cytidylyltransferase [Gemmatimonadota bacterium]